MQPELKKGRDVGDAPARRDLMLNLDKITGVKFLLKYKAYVGDETRKTAETLGFIPVATPKIKGFVAFSQDTASFT
jgi:hypothetical protein